MVHSLRQHRRNRRQGSAALITTIAISAVLVVLFVGVTSIATREIRQSISADNSNRALYAAEAGVEDAVRILTADPTKREETCNGLESTPGNERPVGTSNAAWTCRTIVQVSDRIEGRLSKDESLQINLAKARSSSDTTNSANLVRAKYMVVEWNKPGFDSSNPAGTSLASSYLPQYLDSTTNGWGSRAAILEMTAAWFPRPGNPLASALLGSENVFPVRTVLASPVNSVSAPYSADFSPFNQVSPAPFPTSPYSSVGITPGNLRSRITTKCFTSLALQYSCKMPDNGNSGANPPPGQVYNIEYLMNTEVGSTSSYGTNIPNQCNLSNCNAVLRIRPRYASTNFSIRFYYEVAPGSLAAAYLPDGYATIDVTARSSNYYRRVVAKKQIIPTVYDGVFDNAIFSGKDICKTMQIYKDFRGAPDYGQQDEPAGVDLNGNTITGEKNVQVPNPTAGKNNGCSSDPDV